MWAFKDVKVHWLGHDSIVLEGSKTIIIDPFKARGKFTADLLLISHEHSDHLSEEDITRFSGPTTTIVAPQICREALKGFKNEKIFVAPNETLSVKGVSIQTIPAYNTDKFREPGTVFHPKADGRVGYIITLDGARFYHAGDTDHIPEMRLVEVDVAFLPVSGTYVMTAEEAAEASESLKAKVLVPYHWGSIVGSRADAERFKILVGKSHTVQILEKD